MKKFTFFLLFFLLHNALISQSTESLFRIFDHHRSIKSPEAQQFASEVLENLQQDFKKNRQIDLAILADIGAFFYSINLTEEGNSVYADWLKYKTKMEAAGFPANESVKSLTAYVRLFAYSQNPSEGRLYASRLESALSAFPLQERSRYNDTYYLLGTYYSVHSEKEKAIRFFEEWCAQRAMNSNKNDSLCQLKGEHLLATLDLYRGVERNDRVLVQHAIEAGGDVMKLDVMDPEPLRIAIEQKRPDIVRLLLENGADVNVLLLEGYPPLHFAIKEQDSAMVEVLLKHGASPYQLDRDGLTPLYIAESTNQPDIVLKLNHYLKQDSKLVIQQWHKNVIRSIAVSSDGKYAASCEMQHKGIKIWDVASQLEVKTIEVGQEPTSLVFSADNKKLLVATADLSVYGYDLFTDKYEKLIDGTVKIDLPNGRQGNLYENTYPLAYCPNLNLLATYQRGGPFEDKKNHLQIYALDTRKVREIKTPGKKFIDLALSHDGGVLAGVDDDFNLYIWNVQSGKPIYESLLDSFDSGMLERVKIDFSPDDRFLSIVGGGNNLKILDIKNKRFYFEASDIEQNSAHNANPLGQMTNTGLLYFNMREIMCARYLDDSTLVVGGTDGVIKFWDIPSKSVRKTINYSGLTFYNLVIIPNSETMLFSFGRNLGLVNTRRDISLVFGRSTVSPPFIFCLGNDKTLFYSSENQVYQFDLGSGKTKLICSTPSKEEYISEIHLVPNTNQLVIGSFKADTKLPLFKAYFGPDMKHQSVIHPYQQGHTQKQIINGHEVESGILSTIPRYQLMQKCIPRQATDRKDTIGTGTIFLFDLASEKILWKDTLSGINFIKNSVLSADGQRLGLLINGAEIVLYDVSSGNKKTYWNDYRINLIDFVEGDSTLINLEDEEITIIKPDEVQHNDYYTKSKILFFLGYGHGNMGDMAVSPKENYIAYSRYEISSPTEIQIWDVNKKQDFFLPADAANVLTFSPVDSLLAAGTSFGSISLWDVKNKRGLWMISETEEQIQELVFSADGKYLFGKTESTILVIDVSRVCYPRLMAYLYLKGADFIVALPNGYYFSSKGFSAPIAFSYMNRAFPFEQFDVWFNEPAQVIATFAPENNGSIKTYEALHKQRLERMHVTSNIMEGHLNIPELQIPTKALPLTSSAPSISFTVLASDAEQNLDWLRVYVNDVPVYGQRGLDLRPLHLMHLERTVTVTLSPGLNKIQACIVNHEGMESLKSTYNILHEGASQKPDLYLVSMGVSEYKNSKMKLDYATKDATDFAQTMRRATSVYDSIHIVNLSNQDVTIDHIRWIKNSLQHTGVDDHVIVFYSGHGLLDEHFNYYLATTQTDFSDPSGSAIPYEELENLLDSIPARQKLLLIDACHSGEIDASDVQIRKEKSIKFGEVTFKSGRSKGQSGPEWPDQPLELMKELFADLRLRTGATVIASSRGSEVSIESDQWENGVFTFCLLKGLVEGKADLDKNNKITISEMEQYLSQAVPELTDHTQIPTSRIENISNDFIIWDRQ